MDPGKLSAETKYRLLLEISQKISGTLDLDTVLQQIIDTLCTAIPCDAAGIFVLNKSARPLGHRHATNFIAGVALRGFKRQPGHSDPMLRSGKGIVGHVIQTGESVIAPDVRLDPHYIKGRPGTLSEIAVPILVSGQVIGALNLESNRLGAFTEDDVEILRFFASAAAVSIEKAVLHRQLLEKRQIENQLKTAREVQDGLLPGCAPRLEGYDIAAVNVPTWEIGGDYYDYLRLPTDTMGLAIADVSGKGVPAALIMATFRAALRAQLARATDPVKSMRAVNSMLVDSIGDSKFVTAIYGILDPENGTFTFANCGHNPPLLLRTSGETESIRAGGPPLGIIEDMHFEMATLTMNPGDVLALYTDGVVEVMNSRGEEFETERLVSTLRRTAETSADKMIESVVRATQSFSHTDAYADDFTLVIVKRESRNAQGSTCPAPA